MKINLSQKKKIVSSFCLFCLLVLLCLFFIDYEKAIYSLQSEQHVQFINDNQIVIPVKKLQNATAPQARPSTSVGSRNT